MRPFAWFCLIAGTFGPGVTVPTASAQSTVNLNNIANAVPDECWKGLGLNGPPPVAVPPCTAPAIPKVNQSYVWSLTTVNNHVWFGTTANALCTAGGEVSLVSNPGQTPTPFANASWACEFGESPYSTAYGGPLPPAFGDLRPPLVYMYNQQSGQLTNMTPYPGGVPATQNTTGLRAVAAMGDLVLFGGPDVNGGIDMFAFQDSTQQFLGQTNLKGYDDIRIFSQLNGIWYAGVGKTLGGGSILRWTGSLSPAPCASCFSFETVGNLDADAANIAVYNGRIFATTWPNTTQHVLAGLWMSPIVPTGGLTPLMTSSWQEVWRADDYEPDPVIVQAYGGGALASFDGYLYWGTMIEPFTTYDVWENTYGTPQTQAVSLAALTGSFRATTLFRGTGFGTGTPLIQLVYGDLDLPVYKPPASPPLTLGTWVPTVNNMPSPYCYPLFGVAGYGYPYNNYTWSMAVWNNRLWIGTMDWSFLAATLAQSNGYPIVAPINPAEYGADLYSFANATSPANPENMTGLGNYLNYGVRNIVVSTDGASLFIGMANSMNLATVAPGPYGGWELLQAIPNH
jgi:hypothetical protein